VFPQFVDDFFLQGGVTLVSVPPESMCLLVEVMDRFNLDFDDAYQYVAAEESRLVIVSFNRDFDRTDRGRQAPSEIVALGRSLGP